MKLEILPVTGIGEVVEGDDLAELIASAAPWLRDGDVLVVTSKIVSKAEGRLVRLPAEEPAREAARERVLAAETARVVARRGPTRIVQTHHGFVMASAGIDNSNVDPSSLVLLPVDPDRSARDLRTALRQRYGLDVAVIVSDTMGRPWRNGLTDVALGVAGMSAIRDHRGEVDRYGNQLQLTQMAVVDELAGAAELVKGKCDQVPVAVVRGYLPPGGPVGTADATGTAGSAGTGGTADATGTGGTAEATSPTGTGARVLVRDAAADLFALGTAEAMALGLRTAATLPAEGPSPTRPTPPEAGPPPPVVNASRHEGGIDPAAIERAGGTVAGVLAEGTTFRLVTDPAEAARLAAELLDQPAAGLVLASRAGPDDARSLIRFGADLHRFRTALAAEGLGSQVLPDRDLTGRTALLVVRVADGPAY